MRIDYTGRRQHINESPEAMKLRFLPGAGLQHCIARRLGRSLAA